MALTCTHAALVRRRLIAMNFKYDNIVMEESAQILEVETFIPMLLQVCDILCEPRGSYQGVLLPANAGSFCIC